MGKFWTPEKKDELRRLWLDKHSAEQIAVEIGATSRNAVLGKVHRLGLSGQGGSSQRAGGQIGGMRVARVRSAVREAKKPTPKPATWAAPIGKAKLRPRPVLEPVPEAAVLPPAGEPLSILDLPAWGCKWPVTPDSAREHKFCGAQRLFERPYCMKHDGGSVSSSNGGKPKRFIAEAAE